MDMSDFLARARSALSMPTLYWLGRGGWLDGEAAQDQPGRAFKLAPALAELQRKRPTVHAKYMAGLAATGLDMATLPALACDCSGFVCWALGVARDGSPLPDGWINTDRMWADALGPQRLFAPLAAALPGALLVYPKPDPRDPEGEPGHVGIVTEVDASGRATRVLHCSPYNFALAPPAGLPRNAIAQTDTTLFDAQPTTRIVSWKAFVR